MVKYFKLHKLIIGITLSAFSLHAWADVFKVNAIDVEGLQRISKDTVLNYVPVKPGQDFNTANSADLIRSLYATNFFNDVSIDRRGNDLVIKVVERSTIGAIKVSGYSALDKDKVNEVLKTAGLVEGNEFSEATLEKFVQSLKAEYYNTGHYNVHVDSQVTPIGRGRVNVIIKISEGRIAKVEQINILGNHAFSQKELIKQLDISTSSIITFFTRTDQYTREKLDSSMDKLANFYQDHGYVRVHIDSAQAQLAPDRNSIFVTFKVTEGAQYKISQVQILGTPILSQDKLQKIITIKPGQIYSRQKIKDIQKALTDSLGDLGYAFANISVVPKVDDASKEVGLTFFIDPGKRVYVRHITFTGNNQTADVVLRRELRQMEGSLSSTSKIRNGEERIKMLGSYITDAKSEAKPIDGKPDQVDINYNVTEAPPASAIAGISYGTDGFGFNASVNNSNMLGSGKSLSLALDSTPYVTTYSINYLNPYYTIDGISRGFNFYVQKYNPGRVNIANYSYDTFGGAMNYSVPISEKNDSLQFGIGYQNTKIGVGNSPSQEVLDFFNKFNTAPTSSLIFNQGVANLGWSRNGFDRYIFPTRGLNQSVGTQLAFPVSGRPLDYYKLNYNARWYHPVVGDFIFSALGGLGYGGAFGQTNELPFFQNYFSGGIGSVRGFTNNTLGPRDSLNNPIGGNFLVNGSVSMIFPNYISPNNLRTSWFVDAGNVYNTHVDTASTTGASNPHAGPIRYSTGLGVEWRMPVIGQIDVSVAEPINSRPGDQKTFFQFTFGTQF